jgi:ribosomal protein L37AE/L43A
MVTSLLPSHDGHRSAAGLLKRMGVVLVAALGAALIFALLYISSPGLAPQVMALVSAAGVGLLAGFASRLALRRQRFSLRLAAALGATSVGMGFLGWITWGLAGVALAGAPLPQPDWGGLAKLGLAFVCAWLVVRAWPRSGEGVPSADRRRSRRPSMGRGMERPAASLAVRLPPSVMRRIRPRAHRVRQRVAIQLKGQVEHRCPFCLETVQRRDPRGVVTCPECRTRHHADCWAVAGVCQVPHHHR